jgi:hypothetical protein
MMRSLYIMMMRTTINIRDDLLSRARQVAARSGRSLGDVVDDALVLAFARGESRERERVELPSHRGEPPGLRPGVDIRRSAELWDLLDEPDADP